MKYVLLLRLPSTADASDEADLSLLEEYAALKQELQSEGVWLGGQALHPAELTTQVAVRDEQTLVVDGPLAETAEQVAGYYLIDCRDLDEAIAVAARIPGARAGSVEVRPVWDYEQLLAGDEP